MSCTDARQLICNERDGPLDPAQRARLDEHVAQCVACEHLRSRLDQSVGYWRRSTADVAIPDTTAAWYEVRRELRTASSRSRWRIRWPALVAWVSLPVAATVAMIVAFNSSTSFLRDPAPPDAGKAPDIARADFVDVPGSAASTMVYVDHTSGWLVVWADNPGKG